MNAGDLTSDDLSLRLGTGERDDLEFEANGDDRGLLRKAVCALANDLHGKGGGHLLIGVDEIGATSRRTRPSASCGSPTGWR